MKVLIVTGIWPPDVGGPASHAPEVARFLAARGPRGRGGHDGRPIPPLERAIRCGSPRVESRSGSGISTRLILIARRARRADAVYSTGMFGRSGIGSAIARRPFVLKLTGDPAFERLRARGVVHGDVDEFQKDGSGGLSGRASASAP